ncbi:Ribonuclease 3 [Enhygromyxa salina]|uniref:Ribonuclease 3 n=1 Tax=Enhygromyxa salina TaxID=215803 RepID=A0A2S9YKA8_9BACT|nr:ribonuclease III [Enhygromyxa salina]PRQ05541.1 Ribonuclease 3 [Enhygromyxa salina]
MSSGLPKVLRELPSVSEDAGSDELAALTSLGERLGHGFARPQLLRVALTVGSWANENRDAGWPSNACLEFFGDAVLYLVAADALWRRFPELDEGPLTRLRASVVSERSLARVARDLELGEWLFLGRGDEQRGARDRDGTLADALEAVLGAVFLDAREAGTDPSAAAAVVFDRMFGARVQTLAPEDGLDPKSRLQQLIQAERKQTPVYTPVGDPPPPEAPHWRARVEIRGDADELEILGQGEGRSLRAAERNAALDALRRRRGDSS